MEDVPTMHTAPASKVCILHAMMVSGLGSEEAGVNDVSRAYHWRLLLGGSNGRSCLRERFPAQNNYLFSPQQPPAAFLLPVSP